MNTARMSMKKQWTNIGAGAFRRGLDVGAVLTKSDSINQLIRAGYERAKNKTARERKVA
jgi:hypothetical protein